MDLSQNPNIIKAYKYNKALAKDPIYTKIKKAKVVD
jgi:hypothetical protein